MVAVSVTRFRLATLLGRPAYSTPGLQRFTAAHSLAAAGDGFVAVSLAGSLFFSISPEASRDQVLLYLVVNLVPFTLLAPFIGPLIDRSRRSHRLLVSALYAIRAVLAIGLAVTLFDLGFYFFALALLIAGKASGVTRQALVPTLVERPEHLVAANSRLARLSLVAGTTGAAAGAAILATISATATLVIGCMFFLAASATATRLPVTNITATGADEELAAADVQFLQLHTPTVAATSWAFTVIRFAVGFFVFAMAFALRSASEPAYMYAIAGAAYSVGTFGGNALAPLLRRRTSDERLTAGALVSLGVVAAFGALGPSRPLVVLVAAVLGLAASIGRQGFDALVQARTPLTSRGTAFARFETRFQLGWVGGAVAATSIAIPIRLSMAVVAVAMIPAAVFFLINVRELRRFGVDDRRDPMAVARRRLGLLRIVDREADVPVAAVELAGIADLMTLSGHELSAHLREQIDGLRHAALGGDALDAVALAEAVTAVGAVLGDGAATSVERAE